MKLLKKILTDRSVEKAVFAHGSGWPHVPGCPPRQAQAADSHAPQELPVGLYEALAEKLNIDRGLITFQVLLRTFGTTMQKHGTIRDVQAHLRHVSIMTTRNVYVQKIPKAVRAAVNATANEILGLKKNRKSKNLNVQKQMFRIVP